ncbi:MAG: glycerophosphodiester phosphodiesterase [bacterium]|nr:glycerophosphodiester phosphodiesterase [bacterium]
MLLIAHRGNTISFPENTLQAFLSAFDEGTDGIELDVHLHGGEVIVVHNYLFDRNRTYPKLADVLEKIHSKGRIEIEIKEFSTEILKPLNDILDKFPQADFEITTSEIPLAPYIKELFPEIPLGLILHDFFFQVWMTQEIVKQKLVGWGKLSKADRLHVSFKVLSQFGKGSLVEELHDEGFTVHSHIYNVEDQNKHLSSVAEWGVDQCTFDNIGLLNVRKNA